MFGMLYLSGVESKADFAATFALWFPLTPMCGIGEASQRQTKSEYTELLFLAPSFMAVKCG